MWKLTGFILPTVKDIMTINKGLEAMKAASMIAEKYGISDITLDEINAEIAEARKSILS